jgi:hypothetical protein
MIKDIASCPYCRIGLIAIDVHTGEIRWNPDRVDPEPCRHLACLWAQLGVWRRTPDGGIACVRGVVWLWEHGRGMHKIDTLRNVEDDLMTGYMCEYGGGGLPHDLIPTAEHEIVGGGAEARETARQGTGEFVLSCGGEDLGAILDGWAVFSPVPARVMQQIRRLREHCTF